MIKPSAGWGRRMDYEVDQLEWGGEQGNVTENMNSFDSKTDNGEISETPLDPTIIGMPPRPKPAEKLEERLKIYKRMKEMT